MKHTSTVIQNQLLSYYCILCPLSPDIDDDFRDSLSQLVPLLVSRDNLKVKKINGNPVTGSGLLDLFKVCT